MQEEKDEKLVVSKFLSIFNMTILIIPKDLQLAKKMYGK